MQEADVYLGSEGPGEEVPVDKPAGPAVFWVGLEERYWRAWGLETQLIRRVVIGAHARETGALQYSTAATKKRTRYWLRGRGRWRRVTAQARWDWM